MVDTFTDTAGDYSRVTYGRDWGDVDKAHELRHGSAAISDEGRYRSSSANNTAYYASGNPASANYAVEADFVVKSPIARAADGVRSHVNGCEHDVLLSLPGGR